MRPAGALTSALLAVATAAQPAAWWLPGEYWLDDLLRRAGCAIANRNQCYEPSGPFGSPIPYLVLLASLVLTIAFLRRRGSTAACWPTLRERVGWMLGALAVAVIAIRWNQIYDLAVGCADRGFGVARCGPTSVPVVEPWPRLAAALALSAISLQLSKAPRPSPKSTRSRLGPVQDARGLQE